MPMPEASLENATDDRGALVLAFSFHCSFQEYRDAIMECLLATPKAARHGIFNTIIVNTVNRVVWWFKLRDPLVYRIYESGYEKTVSGRPSFWRWEEAQAWSDRPQRIWILHERGRSGFPKSELTTEQLSLVQRTLQANLGMAIPLPPMKL